MGRERGKNLRRWLAAFAILAITLAAVAQEPSNVLLLEVVINGQSINKVGEFSQMRGELYATPDELRILGLIVPKQLHTSPVALTQLGDIRYHIDVPGQRLLIRAADEYLSPTVLQATTTRGDQSRPAQSASGAVFNYNVIGASVASRTLLTGQFDGRFFSPYGVLNSEILSYLSAGDHQTIRLDSTFTHSDPGVVRRFRVGDFVTGGIDWTRSVRMAGLQISSDYSMRPDLVTFPVPGVSGQVAVPSTVDLLVNGVRQLSSAIPAGPFQVQQLPVVTGAGEIAVIVTDPLGQQTTRTLPFYASSKLLAPSISEYSFDVGAVRENYGFSSNDYAAPAASLSFRRGILPGLTMESHAEAARGLVMAGGSSILNLAERVLLNFSVAGSDAAQRGWQVGAGAERNTSTLSLSISALVASSRFRDIASLYGEPVPRLQTRAAAGITLARWGSIGLAYTGIDRDASPVIRWPNPSTYYQSVLPASNGDRFSNVVPARHVRLFTASYSKQLLRNVYAYATGYYDLAQSKSAGALLGISLPLGARGSISASFSASHDEQFGTVQAARSVIDPGDVGGQLLGTTGRSRRQFAELDYKTPWSLLGAGIDHSFGQTTSKVSFQGALSFIDGTIFPSNAIYDSFAVVDTAEARGVRVLQENRVVGVTNASGKLLVPGLRSYDANLLSIEPRDVPVDATVGPTEQIVRPLNQSGVIVTFPIRNNRAMLLRLVDSVGKLIPPGSVAVLKSTGIDMPVGFDGEVFAQNLGKTNQLTVREPSGRTCQAEFDFQAVPNTLPTVEITCQSKTPKQN